MDKNKVVINYGRYEVTYNYLGNKTIVMNNEFPHNDAETFSMFDVVVDNDGDIIPLGMYYTKYNPDLIEMTENFIDNIDDITFNKGRFIGDNNNPGRNELLSEALIKYNYDKKSEKKGELYRMLKELKSKKGKDLEKVRRAMHLQLRCSAEVIPDSMKRVFLDYNRRSILDFKEIDQDIMQDIGDGIQYERDEEEHLHDKGVLDSIEDRLIELDIDINNLERVLENVENTEKNIEESINLKDIIKTLRQIHQKTSRLSISKRRDLTRKINDEERKLNKINFKDDMQIIRTNIKRYNLDVHFPDFNKLNPVQIKERLKTLLSPLHEEYVNLKKDQRIYKRKVEKHVEADINIEDLDDYIYHNDSRSK